MRHAGFLVTGTDTGIGKTTVSCALAAALRESGLAVGVAKPVETGCEPDSNGDLVPADAVLLRYFSKCSEPLESICPCRCREPLAPAVALRRERREMNLGQVRAAVTGITQRHDVTLVEGAGGLLVPVSGRVTFADLAREWRLPVIVIVGKTTSRAEPKKVFSSAVKVSAARPAFSRPGSRRSRMSVQSFASDFSGHRARKSARFMRR